MARRKSTTRTYSDPPLIKHDPIKDLGLDELASAPLPESDGESHNEDTLMEENILTNGREVTAEQEEISDSNETQDLKVLVDSVSSACSIVKMHLPDIFTIQEVTDWHSELISALDKALPLEFDGGDVEMIDGAGLQLLIALSKEATERKIPIAWVNVSAPLEQAAAQLGITGLLALNRAGSAPNDHC